MELNITLLVQIFHFGIAYLLLDKIFLRVALAHVRAEDRRIAALESVVQEQQQRITDRLQHNEQDWTMLQRRLQSEAPDTALGSQDACQIAPFGIDAVEVSEHDVERVVQQVKRVILREVARD